MQPLVSVVIPCYKQAHFLADAVESVLAQTHVWHEIIIVNDGSPDTPLLERVIALFGARVRYVRQENRGLGAARNTGLAASRGEFVAFLDSDDRLLPNALAAGVRAFEGRQACALVWGFHRQIDAEGKVTWAPPDRESPSAGYRDLLRINVVGPPVGVLFRRSMLVEVGGFSLSLWGVEDWDAYLRLVRRHEIHCHAELIADYRRHEANMSSQLAGMHRSIVRLLSDQKEWIRGDSQLMAAREMGRQVADESYDWGPRLRKMYEARRDGHWASAVMSATVLLVKYPQRFSPIIGARLRRLVMPADT